ncbi:MAG: transposase, partial [Candidatus Altiarchaeota archaeon]|nr:transposase [Candidatus Altiarchaeota archaeon]
LRGLPLSHMAEIKAKTEKGSVFYTDDFKSYKSLKHYGKHSKIKKTKAYAIGRAHINGIEGFWSFAKERFHKYNEFYGNSCTPHKVGLYHGIHKANYYLYLKEMEFRFNNRNSDIFKKMFKIIYG